MSYIFEITGKSGEKLREVFSENAFYFEFSNGDKIKSLPLYSLDEKCESERNIYLGYTMEEVLASGRDILGEKLIKDGDPDYSEVKKVMPKIEKSAYCFLGSPASWSGVTVDTMGNIFPQESGRDPNPEAMFRPELSDATLGSIKPKQMLLGKELPVMISLHTDGISSLEFLYFVEPGDTGRDPIVWIREKRYENKNPESTNITYRAATISMDLSEIEMRKHAPAEDIFLEALADTVAYWIDFYENGAKISIPEKELERVGRGAMAFASLTFTAGQAHYGHKYYGRETHDNFPPNYIWSIEAACLCGRWDFAKRIFSHLITYALNDNGSICYRQGLKFMSGASATEYSMLLWLADRYSKILLPDVCDKTIKKLTGMGDIILSHLIPCPEFEGRRLIKMCAEADNNVRVNVYLNNNLWSIRGLEALANILGGEKGKKYSDAAEIIKQNINCLIEEYAEKSTPYGDVVPFRFGYPAIPYTLSNCETFSVKVSDEERERYFKTVKGRRDFDVAEQEITENTYANYRYYPEILSSMLLSENYADGISKMRDELGGNLLGMTRFRSWIDNWPVLNYARFLIETGKIEKYLLLLYAHTAHHGHPELMCYYEQIKVWGEVSANDCVPSLLTTPIMLAWAFAYEKMDGTLSLLSAIPKDWYSRPFSAIGIGYSGGTVNITSDGREIAAEIIGELYGTAEITLRNKEKITRADILFGEEFIEKISDNKIIFKSGIQNPKIILKA